MKLLKIRCNVNKNVCLLALLFIAILSTHTFAQTFDGFGIKAGLNYNANGDYFESISSNAQHPDRNVGYHFGIFGKIGGQSILDQN